MYQTRSRNSCPGIVLGYREQSALRPSAPRKADTAQLAVYDMPGAYHPLEMPWPQPRHDAQRTATYSAPSPNLTTTVRFSSATYRKKEDAGMAIITVTLSAASDLTVTVNYSTSNGTATPGVDYVMATGVLTFAPGIMAQTYGVSILDDAVIEGHETVNLGLGNSQQAILGTPGLATLTLVDDDAFVFLPVILK